MIRIGFAILFLALGALPAAAQRVNVLGGEHADFTRLVFYLPDATEWRLEKMGDSRILRFERDGLTFNTAQAFDKIPRSRITALRPIEGESGVRLDLACDCPIEGYYVGRRYLVLDISNGAANSTPPSSAAPTVAAAEAAAQAQTPREGTRETRRLSLDYFPLDTATAQTPFRLGFGISMGEVEEPAVPLRPEPSETQNSADQYTTMRDEDLGRLQRVQEAQDRLIEQISRAATQGLLVPRKSTTSAVRPSAQNDAAGKDAQGEAGQNPHDAPMSAEEALQEAMNHINLKAETSVDRDLMRMIGELPLAKNGQKCLDGGEIEIGKWGDPEITFGRAVGQVRARLLGEFDKPDPKAARDLVRLYLHYGFGAEALAAAQMLDPKSKETGVYHTLAQIMERGFDPNNGLIHSQMQCDSPVALWAILAHEALPSAADPDVSAALRTFSGLPLHLRAHVGPMLSQRFLAAGMKDEAERVLRLLARGIDAPDAKAHMARAELELAKGEVEPAVKTLDTVVSSNTEQSPEALVKLIDTKLARGEQISPEMADLAGAYAFEQRETVLGDGLLRVNTLALADAGKFHEAFKQLRQFKSGAAPEAYHAVRSQAVGILTQKAADMTFLEIAVAQQFDHIEELTPEVANSAARRLIALGFAAPADRFLEPSADGPAGRERRILRARAALLDGRPLRAEADVVGLGGADAEEIRAQARALTGDHAAATEAFMALDNPEQAKRQAWLAGSWDSVQTVAEGPMAQAAALMVSTNAPPPAQQSEPQGVLARNRALLEQSAEARALLDGLLNDLRVDSAVTE